MHHSVGIFSIQLLQMFLPTKLTIPSLFPQKTQKGSYLLKMMSFRSRFLFFHFIPSHLPALHIIDVKRQEGFVAWELYTKETPSKVLNPGFDGFLFNLWVFVLLCFRAVFVYHLTNIKVKEKP